MPALLLLAAGCTVVASEPGGGGGGGGGDDGGGGGSSSGSSSGGSGSSGSSTGGGIIPDAGGACAPGNVSTYQAGTYHPASGAWQGACVPDANGDPITAFYNECLGPEASIEHCNAYRETYAACSACLLTPPTAAKYGPLIDHGAFVTANVAGCLELAGDEQPDASQLFCASAVQALDGCETAACDANCPVHDAASLSAYEDCATTAETGGCQTFTTAAECATAEQDAGTLGAACLADFQTFYQVVAPVFCAPPPDDAGVPGPAKDAAAE
ncbi:MAG: hypothetical protein ACRELB_24415 [Polyangiaceae bacterium]